MAGAVDICSKDLSRAVTPLPLSHSKLGTFGEAEGADWSGASPLSFPERCLCTTTALGTAVNTDEDPDRARASRATPSIREKRQDVTCAQINNDNGCHSPRAPKAKCHATFQTAA